MLCENGCGEESTYITKKLKHVCNKNAAKCSVNNPKGRKKKSRTPATVYIGDLLCEYCRIHTATHSLVNGKKCCASTAGNCKEIRKDTGKKISKSRNQLDINTGLKNSVIIARKAARTKANDIDEFGVNANQRNAERVALIKANDIDENGLNAHQRNGKRYTEWLQTEDGQKRLLEISTELKKHLNEIDPDTGLSESQRRAAIMVQTKLNNINELGLNGFEQAHWKGGKNTGFINGIFWQYSNERRFLERAVIEEFINDVRRGPSIRYIYDDKEMLYMPDYIVDNSIYEIKSKYTMYGPNNQYLRKNVAKLLATRESGYDVYVVIDDVITSLAEFLDSVTDLLE